MTRRWFPRLSAEEKAIKFGLTRLTIHEVKTPRPSRHAVASDSAPKHHGFPPHRVILPRLKSNSQAVIRSRNQVVNNGVMVSSLPALPLTTASSLTLFVETVDHLNGRTMGDRIACSPVRRVRIAEGLPSAFQMTCVVQLDSEADSYISRTILYFGIVVPEKSCLRMMKVTVKNEAVLQEGRGEVAAYLRRWASSFSTKEQGCSISACG